MIAGIFHQGSGLGNQLFRYITTRVTALDKGYDFSMIAPELFKGSSFMNLDMGKPTEISSHIEAQTGRVVPDQEAMYGLHYFEEKGFYYNPEINYLEDNTIIDGSFEDTRYWEHRLSEIDEWLKVEPMWIPDNLCAIGFRGGEYYTVPELGLPKEYFDRAIAEMKKINPEMKFEVHTDDLELAQQFFPDYKCIRDVGVNWRSMKYAKHAIIANSSFYVLPRILSKGITISPKYWNRYNTKTWAYPQNYYKQFIHI